MHTIGELIMKFPPYLFAILISFPKIYNTWAKLGSKFKTGKSTQHQLKCQNFLTLCPILAKISGGDFIRQGQLGYGMDRLSWVGEAG